MSINKMMFLACWLKHIFSFRWARRHERIQYSYCRHMVNGKCYRSYTHDVRSCPYPEQKDCPDYDPKDKPKPFPQRHINIG